MMRILGHHDIRASLQQSVLLKTTAHAYLFSGIQGIGKRLVALEFACMLCCPSYSSKTNHTCTTCEKIARGTHPDVLVESPLKGSIRIDRVRHVQGFLKYAPIEGSYRVIVVDDAHTINRPAQNALLKTLEEPPSFGILILITSKPSSLLPTVLSRLRRIKFGPLTRSDITDEILRTKPLSLSQAEALAGLASGSMGRAFELLTQKTLKSRELLSDFFSRGKEFGLANLLEMSAQLSSDMEVLIDTTEFGISLVRDLFVLKTGVDPSAIVNIDFIDILRSSAQHYSSDQLIAVHDEMCEALRLFYSDTNVNRNLATDVMFLKIREKMS